MDVKNLRGVYLLAVLVGIGFVLWWIEKRRADAVQEVTAPATGPDFAAPYYWSNPGIYDDPRILNGANAPFNSVVNVYVDNPAVAGLANQYIPLFGFVGMTAVGN